MTAAKKQAVKIVPPEKGYPEFVRVRTPAVRVILSILVWAGLLAFFAGIAWFFYLAWTSPRAPTGATGQLVGLKGFYVRPVEAAVHYWLVLGGIVIAIPSMIAKMAVFGTGSERSSP